MKKVVSLLLVLVLALGMSTVAFAAEKLRVNIGNNEYPGADTVYNWEAKPGDTLELPLSRDMFGDGTTGGPVTSSWLSSNRTTARLAIASGAKNIASVAIEYKTWEESVTVRSWAVITKALNAADNASLRAALAVPGTPNPLPTKVTALEYALYGHAFIATTDADIMAEFLTLTGVPDYWYGYTLTMKKDGADPANWGYVFTPAKTATIVVKMVRPFVSVKESAVNLTVYLLIDGKRQEDYEFHIEGTLNNNYRDTWADTYYFDGTKDEVAVVQEYAKDVEWDLGNGLSLFTKLFKEKKYYGISNRDADERDDVVFAKYPDIDGVYNVQVVGLNSTTDYVKFTEIGGDYFVYDKDLNYLGKSNDKLKFSTKYYVANKKLDIVSEGAAGDNGEEPEEEELPEPPPITGGTGSYTPNVNDNPGTGR